MTGKGTAGGVVDKEFKHLPIGMVLPSQGNPRQHMDEESLTELANSIRQAGIIEPVVVRPHPALAGKYEMVAGHRRHRAALMAELTEIPAIIRVLTDEQVLEIQIIENLQRKGLHELDEAEGYHRLMEVYKHSADDLAIKVGKSKGYIYARLKLLDLPLLVQDHFRKGSISASVALLIARVPSEKEAARAAREIAEFNDGEGMSFRQASAHIQQAYMLTLGSAQFDINSPGIWPGTGTCAACPKRTGNQAELFADVTSADVCTDAACYHAKTLAHWESLKAAALAAGRQVIEGKATAGLFGYGEGVAWNSPFEKLDATYTTYNDADPDGEGDEHSFRELLGKKHLPPVALAWHPQTGRIVDLVLKADLKKALAAAGHKDAAKDVNVPEPKEPTTPKTPEQKAREEEKNKKDGEEREIQTEALKRAVALMADKTGRLTAATLRDVVQLLAEERIDSAWHPKGQPALLKAVKTMPIAQLVGLMVELLLLENLYAQSDDMKAALSIFKIDLKKIKAEVRKERAAAAQHKEAPKAGSGGTPAAVKGATKKK